MDRTVLLRRGYIGLSYTELSKIRVNVALWNLVPDSERSQFSRFVPQDVDSGVLHSALVFFVSNVMLRVARRFVCKSRDL